MDIHSQFLLLIESDQNDSPEIVPLDALSISSIPEEIDRILAYRSIGADEFDSVVSDYLADNCEDEDNPTTEEIEEALNDSDPLFESGIETLKVIRVAETISIDLDAIVKRIRDEVRDRHTKQITERERELYLKLKKKFEGS